MYKYIGTYQSNEDVLSSQEMVTARSQPPEDSDVHDTHCAPRHIRVPY